MASHRKLPWVVISVGCPSGIGPEVSLAAAAKVRGSIRVLVGDLAMLREAAELRGVSPRKLLPLVGEPADPSKLYVHEAGPPLAARDRRPGKPSAAAGAAQLAYVEAAYALVKGRKGAALVTGPVSKAAIAHSGLSRARHFRGHTEWLQALDGAKSSVMCFASERLVTSLVTTHVALADVPGILTPALVSESTYWLGRLLQGLGSRRPHLVVSSLNPHAGEDGMFGGEESRAILPGIVSARRRLGRGAEISGPIGAETAYRKAYGGGYDGVVAMYHDQATIPMKLVAFGDAVNVTMGLGVVRTSVDHGTAYDIAWRGKADASGMRAAIELGSKLAAHGPR
jgi:4-hydroxythreonine-4-phosphate dehydrogenase